MNRTHAPQTTLLPWLLGLILAVGTAAVWGMFVVWPSTVWQLTQFTRGPSTSLHITVAGDILLQTTDARGFDTTYRTLDQQPAAAPTSKAFYQLGIHNAALADPEGEKTSSDEFGDYILSLPADGMKRYWYLISDGQSPDGSYFVGYDARTKNIIGYLGKRGHRDDVPPADERFVLNWRTHYMGSFATYEHIALNTEPASTDEPSVTYFVSQGKLWRVDLDDQTVALVDLPGPARSVATQGQPTTANDSSPRRLISVRLPDQILVLDLQGQVVRRVPLPPATRGRMVTLFLPLDGGAIITATDYRQTSNPTDIYRFGPDTDASPPKHLTYAPPTVDPVIIGQSETLLPLAIPEPALWAFDMFYAQPQQAMELGKAASYGEGLALGLRERLVPMLLTLGVALVLAAWCYRRQRRLGEPGALAWAALVLALGPPGFAGYWLHRRWPPQVKCMHCSQSVPRRGAQCGSCASPFEPHPASGVEIFA